MPISVCFFATSSKVSLNVYTRLSYFLGFDAISTFFLIGNDRKVGPVG